MKEDEFTVSETYEGNSTISLITENPPDASDLILFEGLFYQITNVNSADVLNTTIRYAVNALPETEAVPIRNNTL